ncbi:MAG: hypothetical protein HYY42_04475 [Chloroflexi bacterium]|nr:hypothetical protein [Chloroflexota bacterium]
MKGSVAVLAGVLVITLARATVFAPAPRTGEWSVVASLDRPRAYATALALPGGNIVVFGGFDQDDPEITNPTTELIDPATAKVTRLADTVPGRLHQTATITSGGRIVVAGGVIWAGRGFGSTDRVDVFLPFPGTWIAGQRLIQARSDHGAARLADGKVLVTGGNLDQRPLASTEIYDPVADEWHLAAPLKEPRIRFSIAPLPDGRVLVAGGLDGKGRPTATSAIYDPRTDRWTKGPDLSVPRVDQATVVLANGDVLLVAGQYGASGTAERYDHDAGEFLYAGTLRDPRLAEQAALLPDGRVLVVGGSVEKPGRTDYEPFKDAEVWDPRTNLWSEFAAPAVARAMGKLVPTPFGLYLLSGIGPERAPHRTVERLTLK